MAAPIRIILSFRYANCSSIDISFKRAEVNRKEDKMLLLHENTDTKERNMSNSNTHTICPFVARPFSNCYCASTSSLYAEATVYYCGGKHEECAIFRNNCSQKGEDYEMSVSA